MPQEASGDNTDVWGDDGDYNDGQELEQEWRTRQQRFMNEGFRDGVEEGKNKTIQIGFNVGFQQGMQLGYEWGLLQGGLKTLEAYIDEIPDKQAAVRELMAQVSEIPPKVASQSSFRRLLQSPFLSPPVSVTIPSELQEVVTAVNQEGGNDIDITSTVPDMIDIRTVMDSVRTKLSSAGFDVGEVPAVCHIERAPFTLGETPQTGCTPGCGNCKELE